MDIDIKARRTHWHPDIRETIGRAAVLYALATKALEVSDVGTFAGTFTEIRRIQDKVGRMVRERRDSTSDTYKGVQVMVETIRKRGVEQIPGVLAHGMPSPHDLWFPLWVASLARTPDTSGIDPDLLRLLGDYLHWHSWCSIDRDLMPVELRSFRENGEDTPEYARTRLDMAARRAGQFIRCRDELAAPTAVLLEYTLDAGQTPDSHLARRTFKMLREEIAGMDADVRGLCTDNGITPVAV